MNSRPLFIPVVLGTVRKGRASENVAKFVFEQVKQREGIDTELIDIGELKFPGDDAGEQIKDQGFSATCEGLFDEAGNMKDRATYEKRLDKFLGELIWMSKVLRLGRETISI